jgi:hypothetical protein
MAICDIYTATSATNITTTTTAATPVLQLATAATKRAFVVGVRVSIGTTAAAAGNNTLFQVVRVANTTGGETGTSGTNNVPNDSAGPTSQSSAYCAWTTAPTAGSVLWQMELPQTTGSSWEEFPPLGYEWAVPANALHAGLCVFATSSVSTSTPVYAELVYGE